MRFGIGFFLKCALLVIVLGVLFWKFRHDLPSLSEVDPWAVIMAVALLLPQPVLIGVRWNLLLRLYGSACSWRRAIAITWVSVFANQFLPSSVGGDAVRVYYAPHDGDRIQAALVSVVVDRIMALVALVLLIVVFGALVASQVDQRLVWSLGGLCLVGAAVSVLAFHFSGALERLSGQSPALARLGRIVRYILRVVAHPVIAGVAMILSIAVHLLSFASLFLILRGMDQSFAPVPFLAVASILTFIQVMPISIAGWGVREAGAIPLFALIGVDSGHALLASVILGVSYAVASLPGAPIWPYLRGSMIRFKLR